MIYTARQLEQLHRTNGHVTLPYNARLTPAARDWIRARRLAIEYTDDESHAANPHPHARAFVRCNSEQPPTAAAGAHDRGLTRAPRPLVSNNTFLWWCDGHCGAAKAAILAQARETNLLSIELANDPSSTAAAVRRIADELKSGRITGGILAVEHGAVAMVMANRCPSLRAVLGTCLDSVDQAIRQVGANVLVLEHAHRTLTEMRNIVRRFTSAQTRTLPGDIDRQLQELASCG